MILLLLSLTFARAVDQDDVRVQVDLQSHPAMHIPWPMFGKGLTDRTLTHRTWKHTFRQQVSEPALDQSGVRLFLAAAMAAERARNPKQARRLILKQLAYVEDFVAQHPDRYALAKTPAEVRTLLATTDKIVLVHSIEGGHHLLWDESDPAFWAEQGVALFTFIHLRDKELGGAAILDGGLGPIINRRGARLRRKGERRGLSDLGRERLVDLWRAGVVVDFTHMSQDAVDDALELAATSDMAPVFTHGKLDLATDDEFAITTDQLVRVYQLGGLFATGISAEETRPHPAPDVDVCWGTLEAFAWHQRLVQQTLADHAQEIFELPAATELSDAQRTALAVGWSGDWNGWLSHSRPQYGRKGCRDLATLADPLPIDTRGLAHPGYLPDHWKRVAQTGTDLDPMLRTAERFLQIWERARGERPAQPEPPRPSEDS